MKPPSDMTALSDGVLALGMDKPISPARQRLVDFYELTKPRMNFLVLVTTLVGFYMAMDQLPVLRLINTLVGTALTAASASVLNQWYERKLDANMYRTMDRPLPAGRVRPAEAFAYGLILGIVGVFFLALLVNGITAVLGLMTVLFYLLLYTPLKQHTSLCTIIGAVPGAIPPMMGWTAVHGAISPEALALFAILFVWQMPHFLAIAILYKDDYARGGFKMLPVVDDAKLSATSRQIIIYSLALIPVSLLPSQMHLAGMAYAIIAATLGAAFCGMAFTVVRTRAKSDARRLFFASIIYLPLLLGALMMDRM